MSYPTVSYKTIFESVVRATGVPATTIPELSVDEQERFAELINDMLRQFWWRPGQDFWPGTFVVEQRTIDADGKFVLKQVGGETSIGVIDPEECFFVERPRPGNLYGVLDMVEDQGDRIACFDDACPETPFIRFQLPVPRFTRSVHAMDAFYTADAVVYDPISGECYASLQDANEGHAVSDSDWWALVEFPAMASAYVKWAASAELLAEDDGKYKQAARATRELEHLEETLLPPRGVRR